MRLCCHLSFVFLSRVDPVAVLSQGGMESSSAGEVLGSVRGELCSPKSFATMMVEKKGQLGVAHILNIFV